jgi:hypothetical protein
MEKKRAARLARQAAENAELGIVPVGDQSLPKLEATSSSNSNSTSNIKTELSNTNNGGTDDASLRHTNSSSSNTNNGSSKKEDINEDDENDDDITTKAEPSSTSASSITTDNETSNERRAGSKRKADGDVPTLDHDNDAAAAVVTEKKAYVPRLSSLPFSLFASTRRLLCV